MKRLALALSFVATACASAPNTSRFVCDTGGPTGVHSLRKIVKRVEPDYSEKLRERGSGCVCVEASIDKSGSTSNVHVTSSTNRRLDDAAIRAVEKWQYEAARAPEDEHQVTHVKVTFFSQEFPLRSECSGQ